MHTNQTLNSLIIEDIEKIPFPSAVKEISQKIDWKEQKWNAMGLPAFDSEFLISDDLLYLTMDSEGNTVLKKPEFTGEVNVSTMLIDSDNEESNYSVIFKILFFKGMMSEAELLEYKITPYKEYEDGFKKFVKEQENNKKILSSWWYKWIYFPYFMSMKIVCIAIIFLSDFFTKKFLKFMDWMTPFKP